MHMSNALLSPSVGAAMYAVSAAAIAYSAVRIKKEEISEKRIPVMGVMGAFVFAAQMVNYSIPATGSSGHIGGGILLAAMIGGFPALLAISAVLTIQCLFFADGGLLALGCNIFNMGVIPCLLVYPLVFKPFFKKSVTFLGIISASVISVVLGLQLGAFGVVIETGLSGITELPFTDFLLLMQPIHLAIGFVEGIVTAAVVYAVYKMRPEIMNSTLNRTKINTEVSIRGVVAFLAVFTVITGGVLSLLASAHPDGLEWAIEKTAGTSELELKYNALEKAEEIQAITSFMPDYDFKTVENDGIGTTTAGIVGGTMTFALAAASAAAISFAKKSRKH